MALSSSISKNLLKIYLIILIIALLSITILSFNYYSQEKEDDPLLLIVDTWAGYIPLYVAYENGFFDEEDIAVNIEFLVDSSEVAEKISEKDNPYDGYPCVYPQPLASGDINFNSSAVFVFDYSYGGDTVISSSSIKSIKDLKNKTISVVLLNSFSHRFIIKLLEQNGLTEEDVNIIEVPAYEVLDAIKDGKIDAGHTWEPITSQATEEGYNILATSKETPGLIIDVLAIKKSVIDERAEDVQRLVNALNKAYEFIKVNKHEAYSLMANRTGVSLADLIDASQGIKLISPDENRLILADFGSDISLYTTTEDISDFMIKHGQIEKSFSAQELIDPRFVKNS